MKLRAQIGGLITQQNSNIRKNSSSSSTLDPLASKKKNSFRSSFASIRKLSNENGAAAAY